MSNVIDSRVVEMQFDNSKFAKNCDNTMKQLDELDRTLSKTATGADFSAAERALISLGKQGTESAGQVADSLSHLETRFSAWGTFAEECIKKVADGFMNLAETAAKTLIDASTVGAMKDGLAEYNLLMESMQSMSVLTGKSTEEINDMFDKLNHYADLTKYSFADMTRNLSMFAASGASLDEMEISMEGIANWMAAVGAPASDMNRIIYNIGQAFSKGYLALIDWKSIENSKGMNGQQFVQVFVDEAYKAGKLSGAEYADAMKAAASNNLSGWFREAISGKDATKAFDKDVMLSAFKSFAENPEYIKAATQLKTFSEFLDNVKEEMGSGWQQTWRGVIGDLDNATRLFKGLKDSLYEYWDLGGKARNDLIDEFNRVGGANETYRILTDIVKVIGELKNSFVAGWLPNFDLFPTGFDWMVKFKKAADALDEKLQSMREGDWTTDLFEKLGDSAGNAVSNIMKLGESLGTIVHNHSEGLGQLASKIGDIAFALTDRLFGSLGKIGEKLVELDNGLLGKIIDDIGAISYAFADFAQFLIEKGFLGKAFNNVWKALEDGVDAAGLLKEGFLSIIQVIDDGRAKIAGWASELYLKADEGSLLESFAGAILTVNEKILELKETLADLKPKWDDCWEAVHEGDWTRFSTFIKEDLLPAFEGLLDFDLDSVIEKLQDIVFWRPDFSQFIADLEEIWGSIEFGEDILDNIKQVIESLGETIVSFWHRISSTGIFGNAFTSIKEKLGLDDTEPFKLDIFEDIFDVFKKGSEDMEAASDGIVTSVHNIQEAFAGPNTQKIKVETLSLDGNVEEELKNASLWDTIKEKFQNYWDYVKSIDVNEDGVARWLKLFAAVGLGKTLRIVANAIKEFADSGSGLLTKLNPAMDIPEKLNKILGGIATSITKYGEKLASEAFANKWKTIAGVFLSIVGAIAVFGLLEKLDVDVMGNAMVVMAIFGVLLKVMEAANNFANQWNTLDSVAILAACVGFAKVINSLTLCIAALTLCAKEWGSMNAGQITGIFVGFAAIVAAAFTALMTAGKMMANMWTDLDWAVMVLVLGSVGKLFKTMALTLAELTLLEKFASDDVRTAIMDLVAIWGMVELLVVTVMGFSAKMTASGTTILQTVAVLYEIKSMFTAITVCLGGLALINHFSDSTLGIIGELVGIFAMIEAVLWSVAGCAAVIQNTGVVPGVVAITAAVDQIGDLITALGLVTVAFALIGSDKINSALTELGIVLGELITTLAAFALIDKFLGGQALNVTGLVAVIGSMALVIAALAAFEAATTKANPEQIEASIEAFNNLLLALGYVFTYMATLATLAAAAGEYGAAAIAALQVIGLVWVEVAAGALIGGVAALAFGEAVQLLAVGLAEFAQLDVEGVIANGTKLLDFLGMELPGKILECAAKIAIGIAALGPIIGAALVKVGEGILTQMVVDVPRIIEAIDKTVAASIAQFTLDLSKYGNLILAAIMVDIDELATLVQTSEGIITALGRLGDSLCNTLIASILGKDFADKLVPVADSFTGGIKDALERKIPELNEEGYFIMDSINTGINQNAEENKYALFNKGQESATKYGEGLISQNDLLAAFGMTMGTQASNSLASEEVQSVYNRAGISNVDSYKSAFNMTPEMEELLKTFGMDNGGVLGTEEVLSSFDSSASMDVSSYYEQLFGEHPELEAQLQAAGIDVGAMMSSEDILKSFSDSGESDIESFNEGQKNKIDLQRPEMVAMAAREVSSYYKSQEMEEAMTGAGERAAANIGRGMSDDTAEENMYIAGQNLAAGAENGFTEEANRYGGILDRAREIANEVADRLRRAWNEHSPSKVADEIGAYFGMGLTNGITREGYVAVNEAENIAEDISEAFTTNLSTNGLDDAFTITPEVDLSNVEKAAKKTSSMFEANRRMEMSARYALTGTDGENPYGNNYEINVYDSDTNNGFKVGRDIEKYLVRGY